MHEWSGRVAGLTLITALALSLFAAASVAQPDDEDGGAAATRMAGDLARDLGKLDGWIDVLSEADGGGSVEFGVEEVSEVLHSLAALGKDIERHFGSRNAKDEAGHARKLVDSANHARETLGGKGQDLAESAGLIIRVCRNVAQAGDVVVTDLEKSER